MLDFTVVIPTYNGASRLPKVLEKLQSQINPDNISWEVIVIDNNSSDDTAKIVRNFQKDWSDRVPLRYCFESQQGLAHARQRAILEANGTFIGFLDDDNLPHADWVAAAYSFGKQHPKAGAYSGQIHGDFEVKPPEGFEKIQQFLAIREHGPNPHIFDPENLRLPPGAGLVVRKQAWRECVPNVPDAVGNVGQFLARGDDYEPLLYMYKAGWEICYNPAMHIQHQIPHWRLEKDYLLSLARACGLATCQLRMINALPWQKPIIFARTLLGNLRRVVWHSIEHRGRLKTDLIAAFELEFFWGSLMSPFFYLQKNFSK